MRHFLLLLCLLIILAGSGTGVKPTYAAGEPLDVRLTLTILLNEYTALVANASNAAIGGRTDAYRAATAALDANAVDLARSLGRFYGASQENEFLSLWRSHLNLLDMYITATITQDQALADRAVIDLLGFANDFSRFFGQPGPRAAEPTLATAVETHVLGVKEVIDAQVVGDRPLEFAELRNAYTHADLLAEQLATQMIQQFPDQILVQEDQRTSDVRVLLATAFQEDAYLASRATDALIGGREDEYRAAAHALDENMSTVGRELRLAYAPATERDFLQLWRAHSSLFIKYANSSVNGNRVQADEAAAELLTYIREFGLLVNTLNPNLSVDSVAGLVGMHVLSLKDVVDAQVAGDQPRVYEALRDALYQMTLLAMPLVDTLIAQAPERYGATSSSALTDADWDLLAELDRLGAPATMPQTGEAPHGVFLAPLALVLFLLGLLLSRHTRTTRVTSNE